MKYMGSKSRIAKDIVPILQSYIDKSQNKVYIEPFVGGANIIDKVKCQNRVGFDINKYLIRLLQYVQNGGELPETITREEYGKVRANRHLYPEWYVGCVGFLASYNGRFFDGGYSGTVTTKAGTIRDYYAEARRNIIKQAKALYGVGFECWDYRERSGRFGFSQCVIYCDPPYNHTKQYDRTEFNSTEFWDVMRAWSRDNTVIISEQAAPDDFVCIWEKEITRTQDNAQRFIATEKLFKFAGRRNSA